jgi:uncharacterized protein YdeI (BOF family)
MKKLWIVLLMFGFASPAAAQRGGIDQDAAAKEVAGKMLVAAAEQKMVAEMRYKVAVEARTTTGAPYSAEAVTESTQVLADGNRINQKSVTRVYRDGDGRTRREELDDAGTVMSVSIVDPVAHASYVLEPASRTAHRDSVWVAMPKIEGVSWGRGMIVSPDDPQDSQARERQKMEETAKVKAARPVPPPPPPAPLPGIRAAIEKAAAGAVRREDLGRQNIEGVAATGTRSTTTIAAGAIGNLQPIKVVAEQWFSADLQVLVLTKHSDPRTGETTYRLQSIVRAEPDRSLFTVPPDYTLKESRIREPLMK